MINPIFLSAVILLFISFVIIIRAALKFKFLVYYIYSGFILFLIAPIFPLIWIDIKPVNGELLKAIFILSNFSVLGFIFLINYIGDFIFYERIRPTLLILGITMGILLASTIFLYNEVNILWFRVKGIFVPNVIYPKTMEYLYYSYIFLGISMLGITIMTKLKKTDQSSENVGENTANHYENTILFFKYNFYALLLWYPLVLFKKFVLPTLFGIDTLISIAFLTSLIITFAIKNKGLRFLPSLIESLKIITNSGLFIMDLEFNKQRIKTFQNTADYYEKSSESSIIYTSLEYLNELLIKNEKDDDGLNEKKNKGLKLNLPLSEKLSEKTIMELKNRGIFIFKTNSLIWIFQLRKNSKMYDRFLTHLINKFLAKFPDELGKDPSNDSEKIKKLKDFILKELGFLLKDGINLTE